MEYVYAALILNESGEEINEANLTGVLEAAGVDVQESRVKALVAALEDVDIEEAVQEAAAAPVAATGGAGGAPATAEGGEESGGEDEEAAADEESADEEEAGGDDDEDAGGEGLGELFG